jgi:hypothetical protein
LKISFQWRQAVENDGTFGVERCTRYNRLINVCRQKIINSRKELGYISFLVLVQLIWFFYSVIMVFF